MSEFDVQQFFSLSKDDISAVCERFRDDRRVAAIQLLFLRASGRPLSFASETSPPPSKSARAPLDFDVHLFRPESQCNIAKSGAQ